MKLYFPWYYSSAEELGLFSDVATFPFIHQLAYRPVTPLLAITIVNSNVRRDLLHLGGLIFSLCHDESNTWPADFKVLLNHILNNEQVDPGGYYLHSLHNKSLNWAGSLFRSFVFKVKECRHSSSHFNLGLLLIIINLVLHLYHPNPRVSLLRKFLGKCACIIKIPRSYTKKYVHWKRKKWSPHANAMYLLPISFWK